MRGLSRQPDPGELRVLIDGVADDRLPVTDRGFLFGDGLFETLAVRDGEVALWRWHHKRLQDGCWRLGLPAPDGQQLLDEVLELAGGNAAVRLVLTRGDASQPGYAPEPGVPVRRVVMAMALPEPRPPLRVGVLRGALNDHALGGGLKHLSRLPQVLLARERSQQGWDEGLVSDGRGALLEATQGNLLALLGRRWITPPVGSGVRGVYRQFLLETGKIHEAPLFVDDLDGIGGLAICNALRGVEAVCQVDGFGALETGTVLEWARALQA